MVVTDKPIEQLIDPLAGAEASCDWLLQQVQTLSVTVGHDFNGVVLSDSDTGSLLNTKVLDCTDVINDVGFVSTPLSEFLQSTDLADQRLLLHPACSDLYACLEHYSAHKKATTSAVIVMPKQPGMCALHNCLGTFLAVMLCLHLVMMKPWESMLFRCIMTHLLVLIVFVLSLVSLVSPCSFKVALPECLPLY